MNPRETFVIGNIDRRRERAEATEERTARKARVCELARTSINLAVMECAEADRADFMREAARHLRTLYAVGEGERAAVSLFGSLSHTSELATGKAQVQRLADRLFPIPRNDEGGQG